MAMISQETHPVYCGAIIAGGGKCSTDCWVEIHKDAEFWHSMPYAANRANDRIYLDSRSRDILSKLSILSAARWSSLCAAAGWTCYGAVALSWCAGAQLEDVWSGWLASGFPLKPLPEFERPARFLNPALVPQTVRLREIVTWVNAQHYPDAPTYDLAIAAMIAGLKAPLVFDMAPEMMGAARPQVAAFLKSRMLQQASQSAKEKRLIETWGATVKGSPYDIWETL